MNLEAVSGRTSLNSLYEKLRTRVSEYFPQAAAANAVHRDFRTGDVRHSQADIGKAQRLLGYAPTHDINTGLAEAMGWYVAHHAR